MVASILLALQKHSIPLMKLTSIGLHLEYFLLILKALKTSLKGLKDCLVKQKSSYYIDLKEINLDSKEKYDIHLFHIKSTLLLYIL